MSEKIYKTMGNTGAGTLAIGICILITGIVSGVLLIVNGARLLKNRERIHYIGTNIFSLARDVFNQTTCKK